jgi:hypothetical protein
MLGIRNKAESVYLRPETETMERRKKHRPKYRRDCVLVSYYSMTTKSDLRAIRKQQKRRDRRNQLARTSRRRNRR